MAKRKTTTRKPRAPKPAPSGPRTTEDLDDDRLQALAFQHKKKYQAALAAKKKADADMKNVCKLAKAEMGADGVDIVKDLIKLDTEEGEKEITAGLRRVLRSAQWAGSKIGSQFELFDGPDRTPAVDRAFDAGKRAGMSGEAAKPPHDPSTPQHQSWLKGWQQGQEAHARAGFKGTLLDNDKKVRAVIKGETPPPIGTEPSTATVQVSH